MDRRLLRALAVLICAGAALAGPGASHASQPFAPDSVWNAPTAGSAPIAADSAAFVAELQRQVASSGAWINTRSYSTPVYTVPADQPVVRVALDADFPSLQRTFAEVPLPPDAVPAAGSDAHLTVYQPATDSLWEFWLLSKAADGWHARWGGGMSDVSTDPGYFPNPVGATGTGLPLLGGLMRIAELQAGHIDHALALAIPVAKAAEYVWPAQRSDGRSSAATAIPEGTRLRLDPSLDVASLGLPAVAREMALAAQRYGIVVRDVAGAVTFYGEDPTPTGTDPYPALFGNRYPDQVLAHFPWGRLQVIAPPGATGPEPAPAPVPEAAPSTSGDTPGVTSAASAQPAPATAGGAPAVTPVPPTVAHAPSRPARHARHRRARARPHASRARNAKARARSGRRTHARSRGTRP